jgi:energy-coupling factor transporter ATP-binding protein EcfA2
MIIGLFQRNFKIYKNAKYIPFGTNQKEMFNLFIGQNGVGKSSILEALNCYFNQSEFIYHANVSKLEAFVAPLFLIKKENLKDYTKDVQLIIPIISDVLLNIKKESDINFNPYGPFFKQQNFLKTLSDTHYIFINAFWPEKANSDKCFITFNSLINDAIKTFKDDAKWYKNTIEQFKQDIFKNYSFLYIPVETSIDDFLKLESKGMQELMSENVKQKISKTLNKKYEYKNDAKITKKSILDIINTDLESFIKDVEKTIQNIDSNYDFNKDNSKTNLTVNHLSDLIIEVFFSKRTLKKDRKQIKTLSAGERKKALIDIAYSFLSQEKNELSQRILAIDEPESSLHISMCYDQFKRLEELSSKYNIQLLVTSHWYGSLPLIDKGNLHYIHHSNNDGDIIKIDEYSFSNYFQEAKGNPSDIHFKSFFDLASAIISSLRIQNTNWLIVESEVDKNYLSAHISLEGKNLKILPVGGCAIVILLYRYLHTPISQKSEQNELNGKIFCLIDTDSQIPIFELTDPQNGLLKICRLQMAESSKKIELHKLDSKIFDTPTEIEEVLNPKAFYSALKKTIEESKNDEIIATFNNFSFDENSSNSFIKGDNSIIYPNKSANFEGNPSHEKTKIINFINNHKKEICQNYCGIDNIPKPEWINEIEDFFKKNM